MALIRLYMTMSLDGYVAGPRDSPDDPLGVGGFRLFNWLDLRNAPGPSGLVYRVCRLLIDEWETSGSGSI